jgi:hypothetical protein
VLNKHVLAFPPARNKLRLESAQTVKIVESTKSPCRRAEGTLYYRMVVRGDIVGAVFSERRGTQRSHDCAFRLELPQRFINQQIGASLRGPRVTQHIFQIPSMARRDWTRREEANQAAFDVARREKSLSLRLNKRVQG